MGALHVTDFRVHCLQISHWTCLFHSAVYGSCWVSVMSTSAVCFFLAFMSGYIPLRDPEECRTVCFYMP